MYRIYISQTFKKNSFYYNSIELFSASDIGVLTNLSVLQAASEPASDLHADIFCHKFDMANAFVFSTQKPAYCIAFLQPEF